jgi:hypothetical protein
VDQRVTPIDIVQAKVDNLPRTETIDGEQQQDGVISPPDRRSTVDVGEDAPNVGGTDGARE